MGVIHLVRHGQASFGTDDYDRLSAVGRRQAACLGEAWEAGSFVITHAVCGSMVRHAETATEVIEACGTGTGWDVDPGWNEFDHLALARAVQLDEQGEDLDAKHFQANLNRGLNAWRGGEDIGGVEPYETFVSRVRGAFGTVIEAAGSGEQVVVFTSGGPIAQVCSWLLTHDDMLFQRLNDVVVNASVTTVIAGAAGPRLLSFNEHTHLPHDLVTYR